MTINMSMKKKAFNAGHEREEHDIRVSIGTRSYCCCYSLLYYISLSFGFCDTKQRTQMNREDLMQMTEII